jgi:hypothetical protein
MNWRTARSQPGELRRSGAPTKRLKFLKSVRLNREYLVAATKAEIIETPDEALPFKVVISRDGEVLAETPVTSQLAGHELVNVLLPVLRKHDDA